MELENKKKTKFILNLNINIPKLNLCFCLNDYTKQSEFIIESSKIKVKTIIYEKILNKQTLTELSYSLLLGKLNFKDFSNKDSTFTVLTKKNNNLEAQNNMINEGMKDEHNQIEIYSDNNGYTININENDVNVRFDSLLLIYYYFKGAIPIEEVIDNLEQVELNKNKKNKNFRFRINFKNSQFQLITSFDGTENLYLDIDNFVIIYNSEGKIPYGKYMINLNKISTKIVSKKNIRELFFTNDNFLLFDITFSPEIFLSHIILEPLTINLTYRDLLSFLRVYSINMKKVKNALKKGEEYLKNLNENKNNQTKKNNNNDKFLSAMKKNVNNMTNTGTPNKFLSNKGNIVFTGEFNFEKLDITLIDNSKGSYHPFMNFIFKKIYIVVNPGNIIESSFDFMLFSYNYIACIWEPTIENTTIKFNNIYIKEKSDINNRIKLDLGNISINLSDMAISFTLLTFNNWLQKLEQKRKIFEEEEIKSNNNTILNQEEPKYIQKITNNQIINYTGIKMNVIHNGKVIICPPLNKIELEYINEYNKSKKVLKYISLIYDKEHKFEIPLEKIVTLRHTINNEISIISDNAISENRSINIYLYSPIIFKNKSIYPLQIKIENKDLGNAFILLNQNTISGIPLNYINKNTIFNFMLVKPKNDKNNQNAENNNDDYSGNFELSKILNINTDKNYKEKIKFKNKTLIMKLDHKITNVRTLIINTEYSIINCLPCDLTIHFTRNKHTIKKCTQYFIDNNSDSELFVRFSLMTDYGQFTSNGIKILSLKNNDEDNYINFKDKNNKENFYLKYYFKKNEEENTLIIYSEYILLNQSGIILSVYSKYKDKKFCFPVNNHILLMSLISSKNDYKEAKIQLLNDHYISSKISVSKLIETSPYIEIRMKNNENNDFLNLNIKNKFSYMSIINNNNFKENINTTIFTIIPSCRVSNLLSTKRFFICDYYYKDNLNIIGPLEKQNFHFYGKGINALLGISILTLDNNKCTHLIKFQFKQGIYTLSTGDYTFNLEIRKNPSDGCIDVFVIENDIDNSQILLENLSDECLNIYRKDLEKFMQILSPKEIQPLKLYSLNSLDYMIETSNSILGINFDTMGEQEKRIKLNNRILALIQANGIKMKITFYLIEEFNKLRSLSINNSYNININSISISIIGDNEFKDTKLNNYQRNELLLFVFNSIIFTINVEKTIGVLNKYSIQSNMIITDFCIYNQMSTKGKFSKIIYNTEPFLSIYTENDYYKKSKIIKMKKEKITVSKLEVGIDPKFIIVLFDFWDNILYRMNITNFNVHPIFINQDKKENKNNNNDLIDEYKQSRILLNARIFKFPEIYMKFEITNLGLKELLKERIDCSDFYIWLAKGLVGRRHSLKLEASSEPYNNGGLGFFFKKMYYILKAKIENQITEMGLKGLVGQFKNLFTYDATALDAVKKNRDRVPRAFYGKFKYFKSYDRVDAFLIEGAFSSNPFLINKYYPVRVISGYKTFYLFTTLSMFLVTISTFDLIWNLDYFMIKEVKSNKNKVIVTYNQVIDSKTSCAIDCETNEIAANIAKSLNEEKINNKENILEV